jgi:uncharacterized protein
MPKATTLDQLRRFAIARSLFSETTLARAIDRLGFVQADPIRAPARAQDLTLRHRVRAYRAGDLERRYAELSIEEDFFVNYGFLPRRHLTLMHPRSRSEWDAKTRRHAKRILEFVRERGEVHPRDVEKHMALGTVTNYWGGSSNATTHLLDGMHYRGLLRVARRESGIRVYAARSFPPREETKAAQVDALLALVVGLYAPLPAASLGALASRLRYAAPQLTSEIAGALRRARARMSRAHVGGVDWYWPDSESLPAIDDVPDRVRLLAPFDPVAWDRRRFELFWGWAYRFEAYTPAAKRKHGYYALPLLWRDRMIGWGNLSTKNGAVTADIGHVSGRAPRDRAFTRELEAELERIRVFLGIGGSTSEGEIPNVPSWNRSSPKKTARK